jgi:hypothetical protein
MIFRKEKKIDLIDGLTVPYNKDKLQVSEEKNSSKFEIKSISLLIKIKLFQSNNNNNNLKQNTCFINFFFYIKRKFHYL